MLPFQAVRLRYGWMAADLGQSIPTVNRADGGAGRYINFTEEFGLGDPSSHHANAGGISVVNGPTNPNGAWVEGTLKLWIRDLWAPDPEHRTEIQIFTTKCQVLPGGGSGADVVDSSCMSEEFYAPLHHDDLLWVEDPENVGQFLYSPNVENHSVSVRHTYFNFVEELAGDQRLRLNIVQYHDNPLVPGYGKPYPGDIKKAQVSIKVWPK